MDDVSHFGGVISPTLELVSDPVPPSGPAGNSAAQLAPEAMPAHAPGVCPVCGAASIAPEGAISSLLAVCDVLVYKTLETLGKRLVRDGRDRFKKLGARPWHEAHTLFDASDEYVSRSLRNAWDVVPALLDTHGCCGVTSRQVTRMLDGYVHDLVITNTRHDVRELAYRFESRLGMPVYIAGVRHEHHTNAAR